MLRALEEYVIEGPTTLIAFHRALLDSPCFVRGETCHGLVESPALAERARQLEAERLRDSQASARSSADGARTREQVVAVELDGRRHEVRVHLPEPSWAEAARRHHDRRKGLSGAATDVVVSPMQGTVLHVEVADGDEVEPGSVICVVEAMKMENPIVAHRAGVVSELGVVAGEQVASGERICVIRPVAK
jgi:acetyl-CoA/propionyl-CoA carboxylase biotin carboxyl carrier protein